MLLANLDRLYKMGTEFGITDSEKRRIKISNILSTFFISTNLFYTLVLYFLDVFSYSLMLILGSFVMALVPVLNKMGYNKLGKHLLITNSTVTVLYYSIILGKDSNVYLIFIAFGCLPLVFFDIKEKYSILYALSHGPICIIISELSYNYLKLDPILNSKDIYTLSLTMAPTTFIIVFTVVFNFERLNTRAEEALREIKEMQDGDYFLTSLIIQPLFRNLDPSEIIKTEQFAKQKKTFSFRGKTRDLGGDISIIGKLNFRGKDFTMFVNADAMGKSMQGAGGAIVLGTVVNSILTRNSGTKILLHPKDWLLNTFDELQNVFIEFDGSMLISCFFGLISNESGKMYYFNCEHPAGILYRDKRAEFLESNPAYKIGADLEGNNYKIPILEFQLEQGDVIILGSDGRDDLSVVDERGQRKINEDETHILKIVEKSNASLEQIYKELQKVGEFIDDISLIKISYLGNNFENKDKELDLDHIKNLIQKLKFRKALEELENTEDDSSSSEYIYYKALCMERLGLGTGAISLLDKKHQIIKNHIPSQHLKAYIFYRAGEFEKSKVVLDYCFENNKDSKQTKALIQKVFEKLKSMD